MNKKALHSSSWGRIYLMLRADLVTNKTTLLALFGGLLMLIYFVPRIPILFDTSIDEWNQLYGPNYSYTAVMSVITAFTMAYFYIYLNKRTVHSLPTTFSTLPAEWWEKGLSILAYGLVLYILEHLTGLCAYALEYISNPYLNSQAIYDSWESVGLVILDIHVPNYPYITALMSISWIAFLCIAATVPAYTAMSIRNGFVALFIAAITLIFGTISFTFTCIQIAIALDWDGPAFSNGEMVNPNAYVATTSVTVALVAIATVCIYLTIRKLKAITS
ncbi:MAG: hypothetical protein SOW66_01330 [Porphyromonas sp.]|nr:hypothetical protein [Porphyromonas sp.]